MNTSGNPVPGWSPAAYWMAAGLLLCCATAPVRAQSVPPPVTVPGVFDPDLADVTPAGLAALKDVAAQAEAGANCYPPRVTLAAKAAGPGGASFAQILATHRTAALQQALPVLGLAPDQVHVGAAITRVGSANADDDGVVASFEAFGPNDDTDAPILKVDSTPAKGAAVKPGDKITVTIAASEKYADGHHSWPSGVQSIQLLADDGLVDSKDYGKPPDPCAVQTFSATYTVPANPPAIVHLRVVSEDGAGNQAIKTADFPAGETWEGDYTVHGVPISADYTLQIHFKIQVASDGTITGTGSAHIAFIPQHASQCTYDWSVAPSDFDVVLSGHRKDDELDIQFDDDRSLMNTAQVSCPGIPPSTPTAPGDLWEWMPLVPLSHPTIKAEDGTTNSVHLQYWDARIEIHRPTETAGK